MGLDVDIPDPPELRGPQATDDYDAVQRSEEGPQDDYRREELAGILEDGAWESAFQEWAEHTLLTEDEFAVALDHDLFEGLDFYWEPSSGDVGFRTPPVPDGLERGVAADVDEALTELGRTVSEQLEVEVARGDDEFGFFADR